MDPITFGIIFTSVMTFYGTMIACTIKKDKIDENIESSEFSD